MKNDARVKNEVDVWMQMAWRALDMHMKGELNIETAWFGGRDNMLGIKEG